MVHLTQNTIERLVKLNYLIGPTNIADLNVRNIFR